MPRRKQASRTTVKDIRSILRLTYEQGLSTRAVSERLKISKTVILTYLYRARQSGLACWPLPPGYEEDGSIERLLCCRMGRPAQDLSEPDWPQIARELKRKNVTLTLLWQEYRTAHPDGYGFTWFCDHFAAFEKKMSPTYRNRHDAGATMQTDYAGQTLALFESATGEIRQAQIFVAVLPASNLTFACASLSQKLPDWIEGQTRALTCFGGVPKAMGILSLARRYEPYRLEAACERALIINAITYSSVNSILKSGLDKAGLADPGKPSPLHGNIRGSKYYH